jgi:anti-sigma B factor antagonist
MMTIEQRDVGGVVILDIDGKLMGGVDSELFQETVQELIRSGRQKIVINLENVKWMNSTGLGILIAGFRTAQRGGGTLKLLHVSTRIQDLLKITKLSSVFESFEAEAEAVESFV